MLDKAQQPAAASRLASGRGKARGWKRNGTLATVATLAASIGTQLALVPSASAAPGSVTGVVEAVSKAAPPAVAQAVPAALAAAPSPAAAQQAADGAPAAIGQTVDRVTSALSANGSVLADAGAQRGERAESAPARQPESAARSGEGSRLSSSTTSGERSGAGSAGATAAFERSSGPIERAARGALLDAKRPTVATPHLRGRASELLTRRRLSARAPSTAAVGELAHAVVRLTNTPTLLDAASREIAKLGQGPAQLVGSLPSAIAPLLAPLLALPSPPTFPSLSMLPSLPAFPSFPIVTPGTPARSVPAQPTTLWLPLAPRPAGDVERTAAAREERTPASFPGQVASSTAALSGVAHPAGALDRPAPTGAGAASKRPARSAASMAGATSSHLAQAPMTAPGTPLRTRSNPSPASSPSPSPGGVAPATAAIAGSSIPIFLTLAGLLLLVAPRVRRVLRLLGESWRLSPLVLIPERPG